MSTYLTGQRKVVEIVSQMGHCLNYKATCEIKTAQAVKAQKVAKDFGSLPLSPSSSKHYVLTVFWVDNFDIKVERQQGSNCVNTTHLVAFQEENEFSTRCVNSVSRTE